MTVEKLKKSGWIIFEAISGSKAYGTDLPTSDTDIRGVYIMPTKDVLKANPTTDGNYPYIPQISDETNDITYYEIGRFIELLEKGNPNILELLNVPTHCVLYKAKEFDKYFSNKQMYLTKNLKNTFAGYAKTQVGKASGMNKKIHNAQPKIRKTLLDFCYVYMYGQSQQKITSYFPEEKYDYHTCGVTKLPNGKGLYLMYFDVTGAENFRGVIQREKRGVPNEIRLSSVSKEQATRITPIHFFFDLDAYQSHCKQHKEYWDWVEKRNPERYKDNLKGNVGYDHKNMMHCVRLVEVAEDIVHLNEIVVHRPNREFLLSIRNGEHTYEELMEYVNEKIDLLDELFENSGLPEKIDTEQTRNLLLQIRLDN